MSTQTPTVIYINRYRRVPFTNIERKFLLQLISCARIFENKSSKGAVVERKKKAWAELTKIFNSQSFTTKRTAPQLKKCWDNIRNRNRKEQSGNKTESENDDVGPSPLENPLSQRDPMPTHVDISGVTKIIKEEINPHTDSEFTNLNEVYINEGVIRENSVCEQQSDLETLEQDDTRSPIHLTTVTNGEDTLEQDDTSSLIHHSTVTNGEDMQREQYDKSETHVRLKKLIMSMQYEKELHEIRMKREAIMLERERVLLASETEALEFQRKKRKLELANTFDGVN